MEKNNEEAKKETTKGKKVAVYLRTSTTEQTTLNQRIAIAKYCLNNNFSIYKYYDEHGFSGALTTRPQLDLMMQDMRKGLFDIVMVWKYDRLGRSTLHLLQILEEFKKKGIRLISTSQDLDTSTPMGAYFLTNLLALGELERGMITERINLGLQRRKEQGLPMGRPAGSKDKKPRRKSGYYLREYNKHHK